MNPKFALLFFKEMIDNLGGMTTAKQLLSIMTSGKNASTIYILSNIQSSNVEIKSICDNCSIVWTSKFPNSPGLIRW